MRTEPGRAMAYRVVSGAHVVRDTQTARLRHVRRHYYGVSQPCRALQRVEIARPHGTTGQPVSSPFSSAMLGLYGSASNARSRPGLAGASASSSVRAGARGSRADRGTESPLDAVTEDLASFDADDNSGPPATRMNAIRAPRLFFPGLSPEAFYFKQTLDESNSSGGGAAGAGGSELGAFATNYAATTSLSERDGLGSPSSSFSGAAGASSPAGRGALPFCRLCREELEPSTSPRFHIVVGNRASHLHHNCREVVLDTLSLLALRGFPIDEMELVWSKLLYDSPLFPRVSALVVPTASLAQRADALIAHLLLLRDLSILDISLASTSLDGENAVPAAHRRRLAFERLEYLGDNAWRNSVSDRIMLLFPDQHWAYSEGSSAFNAFRDAIEMNVTLSFMYDRLHLAELLPQSARLAKVTSKGKADVVEAVLGELHATLWGTVPMLYEDTPFVEVNGQHERWQVALVEHCLTEIYDLLVLFQAVELSQSALPLAKEMAAFHLWSPVIPAMTAHKSLTMRRPAAASSALLRPAVSVPVEPFWPPVSEHGETLSEDMAERSKEDGSSGGSVATRLTSRRRACFTLPATPSLQSSPQPRPSVMSMHSPLHTLALDAIPEETVLHPSPSRPAERRDVFDVYRAVYDSLTLLEPAKLLMPVMCAHRRPVWRAWVASLVPSLEWSTERGVGGHHAHTSAQVAAAVRSDTALPEETRQYFRDARFDLSPEPKADTSSVTAQQDTSTKLRVALENAPPRALQAEPSQDTDDTLAAESDLAETAASLYTPSRYVPLAVKPPLGGVLTERNTCYGTFAFLSGGAAPWESLIPSQPEVVADPQQSGEVSVQARKARAVALWESQNDFFPRRIIPYRVRASAAASGLSSSV